MLLGTQLPFERVPATLDHFTGVEIGEETARRLTESVGAAWERAERAEAQQLELVWPDGPVGPAVQQLSVDGAMVPLVGGAWAEVKTLAIGEVQLGTQAAPEPRTTELSYFSRLCDAATFTEVARVEVHRRGTDTADTVCAVSDGAEWIQGWVDRFRPDAVRILDFPHAAEHLSSAAQAVFGSGTAEASEWLGTQLHELKHGDPDVVLAALRALPTETAIDPAAGAKTRDEVVSYLEKRRTQIAYAEFRAAGYPIGSGAVESANKLVVEARLKGSGMHWVRENVNPMLALRCTLCSKRWQESWPRVWTAFRQDQAEQRRRRHRERHPAAMPAPSDHPTKQTSPPRAPSIPCPPKGLVVDGKPTAQHPWHNGHLSRCSAASPTRAKI